jgi:hypothetical protein
VGLTDAARQEAHRSAVGAVSYPSALRRQRSPQEGLLLIYPISRFSEPRHEASGGRSGKQRLFDDPSKGRTVVGIVVSLPHSDSAAARGQYVVGSAGAAPV